MLSTCLQYGLTYVRDSETDAKEHQRGHRRWARVVKPKPNVAIKRRNVTGGIIGVDQTSPRWLNDAVYERARLFRREFDYDFIQWGQCGPGCGRDKARAFLFIADDRATIAGACAFFRYEQESGWTLAWVWIAPAFRRKGILTRHWPTFIRLFGAGFRLERPLSEAMAAFARKHSRGAVYSANSRV